MIEVTGVFDETLEYLWYINSKEIMGLDPFWQLFLLVLSDPIHGLESWTSL